MTPVYLCPSRVVRKSTLYAGVMRLHHFIIISLYTSIVLRSRELYAIHHLLAANDDARVGKHKESLSSHFCVSLRGPGALSEKGGPWLQCRCHQLSVLLHLFKGLLHFAKSLTRVVKHDKRPKKREAFSALMQPQIRAL